MFYYRLTVTEKVDGEASPGGKPRKQLRNRTAYSHVSSPRYIADDVARMLINPAVKAVKVSKSSQAAYVRATRPGE